MLLRLAFSLSIFFFHLQLLILVSIQPAHAETMSCLEAGPDLVTVLAINKTGTFILSDRREVRLDGILLPYPPTGLHIYDSWPAWQSTITYLEALLVGKEVLIKPGERKYDRYGRLLAHIHIKEGAETRWLQKQLIEEGLARVFPYETQNSCITDLLTFENQARDNRKGIWTQEVYHLRQSDDLNKLAQLQGSFQIIEGKVEDVVTAKGTVYINFGQDWKQDFTASIAKNSLRNFPDGDKTLLTYKGKKIRVRGWVEPRNGPMISVTYPGQIEHLELNKEQVR